MDQKIADCDWSYLSTLKTLREPKQSMPRLLDLLEYLAQPGLESIWVLLDVKVSLFHLITLGSQMLTPFPARRRRP